MTKEIVGYIAKRIKDGECYVNYCGNVTIWKSRIKIDKERYKLVKVKLVELKVG